MARPGPARPGTIVFVESFPPELDVEQRRRALERLAADPRTALVQTVSTQELRAAAEGERYGTADHQTPVPTRTISDPPHGD